MTGANETVNMDGGTIRGGVIGDAGIQVESDNPTVTVTVT